MFRRRKAARADDPVAPGGQPDGSGPDDELEPLADLAGGAADEADDEAAAGAGYVRDSGPYDVSEVDEDDASMRLDLGGLRVPVHEGLELRLDVDQESGHVSAVTAVTGDSAVQLMVFAAPRSEGIWDDIRAEIAAGVTGSGATVDTVVGTFGPELHTRLPADPAAGATSLVPVRFTGVDGPRWFLRAMFTGPAAREGSAAAALEEVVRGCVVVRGADPMAPRDPLPLHLPAEVPDEPAEPGDDDEVEGTDRRRMLPPPRRGPEITEVR